MTWRASSSGGRSIRSAHSEKDSTHLKAKLDLRRYFLDKYHAGDELHVLDCCAGDGVIWGALKGEYDVATYTGVDKKAKPGLLKMDSVRLLQKGFDQEVVDVDTYGNPWHHWAEIVLRLTKPTTVFLTVGHFNGGRLDKQTIGNLGLAEMTVPPVILNRLCWTGIPYNLASANQYGVEVVEAMQAEGSFTARYIGARIERKEP